MKVAKLYLSKKDFAEKFGLNVEDFIIANVTSEYHCVELDLIFSEGSESTTLILSDVAESPHVRRQSF